MTSQLLDDLSGAAAIAGTVLLSPALSRRYRAWGATAHECREPLPGDENVPAPKLQSTRAIDIAAAPGDVWPWLVQLGHGRAGLYSYEGLENLAGCEIRNADRIDPAWQSLAVGDRIPLGPPGYPSFEVMDLVVDTRLVLLAHGRPDEPRNGWGFYLRPRPGHGTRLLVRSRYDYPDTAGQRVLWRALTEPIHFVMERRMLLCLRARIERTVQRA